MSRENNALQEFQALRAEMITMYDRRSTRFSIVWAGISALLTAAVLAKMPELGIVAILLVCSGWNDEISWLDNTMKISAYIYVILEPQLPGLQWQKILILAERTEKFDSYLNRLKLTLFSSYSLFNFASVIVSIILYYLYIPTLIVRQFAFYGLLFLGIIYSFSTIGRGINLLLRWQYWVDKFSDVASRSNS